jgi:drug/metabolite transporter (DMT)-like permease
VVSAFLGVVLLSEPITPGVIIGLPLIVAGSYLAGKHREAYVRKKDRTPA